MTTTAAPPATPPAAAAGPTLDVAYVTVQQHPYGIAVDSFAKEVNATGELTLGRAAGLPAGRGPAARRRPQRRGADGDHLERDLGHRRRDGLPGAAGAVPDHQLLARGRRHRRRHRQVDDRRRPTSRPATSIVLAIHEGGLRKPFGKTPLVTLANWKGKTIRAPQSQVLADGLKALGANVDPLPLPDVNQALQNGAVDGVEANLPLIYTQQWYEAGQERHRQRQPVAVPDGARDQQGRLGRVERRPAGRADHRGRQHRPRVARDLHDPGQHGRPGPRELRRQVPVRHRQRTRPS